MDQYIGRLLDGRYEILEIIGTGGMAVVYKARCHRLNRLVAIKILKDEFARDEEFRRRFRAEGEAVAMLSHPNIVQVYDVSTSDSANFIVMELIDGISLKEYMEKKGVLNWKETLHFQFAFRERRRHRVAHGIQRGVRQTRNLRLVLRTNSLLRLLHRRLGGRARGLRPLSGHLDEPFLQLLVKRREIVLGHLALAHSLTDLQLVLQPRGRP